MDSDEDKLQLDTVNSNENFQDERAIFQEEPAETSPYVMTIEIDKGISEKLHIYYDSVAEEVAYDFCKKHNLDYSALNYLVEEIKNVLAQNAAEEPKEQEAIIEEKEEESVASEDNNKKQRQSDENINFPNLNSKEEVLSRSKLGEKIKNEISIKEENLKENLRVECSNTQVNQSTNFNENNTNTDIYMKTASNNNDNQRIVNTEPAFKESENDGFIKGGNKVSLVKKQKNKIVQEKDFKSFEQKLFSYQIFLDKYKSINASSSTLNNSNVKSVKNAGSSNISVFDKLYNDSKQRKQVQLKVSRRQKQPNNSGKDHLSNILNNRINKHILGQVNSNHKPTLDNQQSNSYVNIGERLYKKGLTSKEETETKLANQRKEEQQKNKEIYTFKPNLRKKNIEMNYTTSQTEPNVLERFDQYRINRENEFKQLREIYEENTSYSFIPKINKNSAHMVKAKYENLGSDEDSINNEQVQPREKHKELYELARLKPFVIKNLEMQHYGHINFTPSVNQSNKQYPDFHLRQQSFSKSKQENQMK
jgi:hypothetical protein